VYYEQIAKSSAHIRREKCNVADPGQIARLFEETPEWPACVGVCHAAGVLSDGTIAKQTRSKYEEVFGPKLHGAYYLHCSRGTEKKLQVNLVMSSMAGFGGSPGQSNHSCGNTGIEAIVDFDRKMGMAGCSIAWGAVSEVGYAARHHLADHATAVRFEHAWACIEAVLYRPYLNVGIQPHAFEMGKGVQAMKQLIYTGLAGRFRKTGFRKPKAAPATGEAAPQELVEVDEREQLAEEPLQAAGLSGEAKQISQQEAAERRRAEEKVIEAMRKIHRAWTEARPGAPLAGEGMLQLENHESKGKSEELGRLEKPLWPTLGQQEVC